MIVVYWPDEKAAKNFVVAHNDRMRDIRARTRLGCLKDLCFFQAKKTRIRNGLSPFG